MTQGQRAAFGVTVLAYHEAEAKLPARSRRFAYPGNTGKAAAIVAKIVKASERNVQLAKAVSIAAPPLFDLIRDGSVTVNKATSIARALNDLPPKQKAKILALPAEEIDATVTEARQKAIKAEQKKAVENLVVVRTVDLHHDRDRLTDG